MNNQRRKEIVLTAHKIEDIIEKIREILNDEQEAYDNMPESLQYSERGMNSEHAQECLESAIDYLEDAVMSLEEVD